MGEYFKNIYLRSIKGCEVRTVLGLAYSDTGLCISDGYLSLREIKLTLCMLRCIASLTHWGRVAHICLSKITIISSDNGLSLSRRQAIIWTNAGILLIRPLGTNFIEILIRVQTFSFKKMELKMSSAKWHPFCLGLNGLTQWCYVIRHYGMDSCLFEGKASLSQCWLKLSITSSRIEYQWNLNKDTTIFLSRKCILKCLQNVNILIRSKCVKGSVA